MSTYNDLNNSFNPKQNNLSPTIQDLKDIKQSLTRLFTTPKGSVPFNRNYGTSLRSLLFENELDTSDICMYLYMDITDFEPRVSVNPSDIEITKQDNNTYLVSCAFTVPSLSNSASSVSTTISDD